MFQKLFCPVHASHGFYAAIWGIILGITLAILFELDFATNLIYLLAALAIIIFSLRHSSIFTIVVIFLAGTLIGNFCASGHSADQVILAAYYGQTITISGTISEDPDDSKSTTSLRLHHLKLHSSATDPLPINGTLYVTLSNKTPLERSDAITLKGKLGAGFSTFIGKMSRPELLKIERAEPGDIFARLKHWFADLIRQFIPSPEVDLGLSYLMGISFITVSVPKPITPPTSNFPALFGGIIA